MRNKLVSADQPVSSQEITAYLLGIQHQGESQGKTAELLEELADLVDTLQLKQCGSDIAKVRSVNPAYIIGSGKAEEVIKAAKDCDAKVIVVDDFLSPSQQRNWERLSDLAVIDRQEVILNIFSARAATREATLQIALAQANYDLPRLHRKWSHLSRQRGMTGGFGGRAGGEQQLELDSRQIRNNIAKLKRQLKEVEKHRDVQRSKRMQVPFPSAAICGYTNAGKSTLLNTLTNAELFTEDKLFATLDPSVRKLTLPGGLELLLTDTVGFIRKLPHLLIEAFKSTLEETKLADFLIEVLDASCSDVLEHHKTTQKVLEEIGVGIKPSITVLNKVDLIPDNLTKRRLLNIFPDAILISAKNAEGLEQLLQQLELLCTAEMQEMTVLIPYANYEIMQTVRRQCSVDEENHLAEGVLMKLQAPLSCQKIMKQYETTET